MRHAFLLTFTYKHRSDLPGHAAGAHNARVVGEELTQQGFDFEVDVLNPELESDQWLSASLTRQAVAPEAPVVVYCSGVVHVDEAGELLLELDPLHSVEGLSKRVPVGRLRASLSLHGIRSAVWIFDVAHRGRESADRSAEILAGLRRLFAPELSGYSILAAVRSEDAGGDGPSPFTSLLLRTLKREELRNRAGALMLSRVVEALREDPDIYTDMGPFLLLAGRRDVCLFSTASTSIRAPVRFSEPPSSLRPLLTAEMVLVEARALQDHGEWGEAGELFKKALLLLAKSDHALRVETYLALATVRRMQERFREMVIYLERALAIEPDHLTAQLLLGDALSSCGDFALAAKARERVAERLQGDDLVELLLALSQDLEKSKQSSKAVIVLERAMDASPVHPKVLSHLDKLYETQGQFERAVPVKMALANLNPNAEESARSLVSVAAFAREHVGDANRSLTILEVALEKDPLTPRGFDMLASIFVERGHLRAYEQALEVQALRLNKVGAFAAEAETWRELAALRKQEFEDPVGAVQALERCVALVPNHVDARVFLAELLALQGRLSEAIASAQVAAWHCPGRLDTYHVLHQWLVREARVDRAYNAAQVLQVNESTDLDEELFLEQYRPDRPVRPQRSIGPSGWDQLLPSFYDRTVDAILGLVAAPAITHKLDQLRKDKLLPSLDPATRQEPSTSTVTLTRTFVWASSVLDVPLPEIYVGREVPGGIAAVPAEVPTAVVGQSVLRGRSLEELAFLVGRDITYYRPSHYVLVLYPSVEELTTLFLAALSTSLPSMPVAPDLRVQVRALSRFLKSALTPAEVSQLDQLVSQLDEHGSKVDLVRWAQAIELAATRAGMLLCGNLPTVADVLIRDDREVGGLSPQDRLNDLFPFVVSEAHEALRTRLGIAVGSPRP